VLKITALGGGNVALNRALHVVLLIHDISHECWCSAGNTEANHAMWYQNLPVCIRTGTYADDCYGDRPAQVIYGRIQPVLSPLQLLQIVSRFHPMLLPTDCRDLLP
jgi:hypothetical protein